MRNKSQTGFTLIELLLVVAIIGMLSTIILSSLGSSRSKSADALIQQELRQAQSQAELYYSSHSNSYGITNSINWCFASGASGLSTVFMDSTVENIVQKAAFAGFGTISGSRLTYTACGSDSGTQSYAIAVTLKSSNTSAWCVDSSGKSKLETGLPATSVGAESAMALSASGLLCK